MTLVRKGECNVPLAVDQAYYTCELSSWTILHRLELIHPVML